MKPRERYTRHGPGVFGDDELLALIIGTGSSTHSPLTIGRSLLSTFGSLQALAAASVAELCAVPGVGTARGVQILAALQAGRRSMLSQEARPAIHTSQDAWRQLDGLLSGRMEESLAALYISPGNRLLASRVLTTGNDSHTIVDPRQIFRPAVRCGAAGLILAHNHPSGDPTPSSEDLAVTRRLCEAGLLVGVELLDHLIIGAGQYRSLAEEGVLVRPSPGWRHGPIRGSRSRRT